MLISRDTLAPDKEIDGVVIDSTNYWTLTCAYRMIFWTIYSTHDQGANGMLINLCTSCFDTSEAGFVSLSLALLHLLASQN